MPAAQDLLSTFVLLWAVIDPIGTVPVFISATIGRTAAERKHIARVAALVAAGILFAFIAIGEFFLVAMGVPLIAFQISGGIILFLFALTMIFGEGKPGEETKMIRPAHDTAVFPLATPSIASPGAMMAVVLLTENNRHSLIDQGATTIVMLLVVARRLSPHAMRRNHLAPHRHRRSKHRQPRHGHDPRLNRGDECVGGD